MVLKEIIDSYKELPTFEMRSRSATFDELVFFTKDTAQWEQVLGRSLGAPAKAPGVAPTEEHKLLTRSYGGIQRNQTLFYKKFSDVAIVAMFWPWGNGEQTTLKIAETKA